MRARERFGAHGTHELIATSFHNGLKCIKFRIISLGCVCSLTRSTQCALSRLAFAHAHTYSPTDELSAVNVCVLYGVVRLCTRSAYGFHVLTANEWHKHTRDMEESEWVGPFRAHKISMYIFGCACVGMRYVSCMLTISTSVFSWYESETRWHFVAVFSLHCKESAWTQRDKYELSASFSSLSVYTWACVCVFVVSVSIPFNKCIVLLVQ